MMHNCGFTMDIDHDYSVSVLIPYHKVNELLYRCVNSVIRQRFKPTEIILISDGCPEKIDILKLDKTEIYLREISLRTNKGPAAARNFGFKSAKGTYISLLDSDDYWSITKLENQISMLKKLKSQKDLIIVSSVQIVQNNKLLKQRSPLIDYTEVGISKLSKAPYLYLGSTAFFARELINKCGLQVEKLRVYEDFEWQIRLSEEYNIKFLLSTAPDVYIEKSYKIHEESFLRQNFKDFLLCLSERKEVTKAQDKIVKAMFYLDLASSFLNKKMYIKFIWNLLFSFLLVPRFSFYSDIFWTEKKPKNKIVNGIQYD